MALGRIPPGLYHDEAQNGLDGLEILSGRWPIYLVSNRGREPLYVYLSALSLGLLGRTPVALRLPAVVTGTLTIPAIVLLARSWFGRRIGLLSGVVLAVMLWHVHLSRVAFRAVTMPLLVTLALGMGTQAWRKGKKTLWLLTGLIYGACFYTYLAVRFTPVALGAWLLILAFIGRLKPVRVNHIAWFALGAGLALAPLAIYTVGHWHVVMGRPGSVSILNPLINKGDLPGTFVRHLVRTLGMFFVRGDTIPRHNLPGRPVFDPALGLMMVLGTVCAVVEARRKVKPALLLVWVGIMLMPTWLAEDAPHFLRATGVLPLLAVIPALGLDRLWRWFERKNRAWVGTLSILILLSIGLGSTTYDYFVRYPTRQDVYFFFETAATELAADVNRFLGSGWPGRGWSAGDGNALPNRQAFVERQLWDEWTAIPFLIPAEERVSTRRENISPGKTTLLILWPHGNYQEHFDLLPHPARIRVWEGPPARGDLDPSAFTAYVALAGHPIDESAPEPLARFEGGIELREASVEALDDTWEVELVWQTTSRIEANYTVFVHLQDGTTPVAQGDGDPAGGYYPTSHWRVGDQVVDIHTLTPPEDWSDEPHLLIGLYTRQTLERLPIVNAEEERTDNAVSLSLPPSLYQGNR